MKTLYNSNTVSPRKKSFRVSLRLVSGIAFAISIIIIVLVFVQNKSTRYEASSHDNTSNSRQIETKVDVYLKYNAQTNIVSIRKSEVRTGYFPRGALIVGATKDYTMQITDENQKLIWKQEYSFPIISGPIPTADSADATLTPPQYIDFDIAIPFDATGRLIEIINNKGVVVASSAYPTIGSQAESASPLGFTTQPVNGNRLDILVIGEGFVSQSMKNFMAIKYKWITYVFTYIEPFSMRTPQLNFNYIESPVDLGFYIASNGVRYLDFDKAKAVADQSGLPYDKIFIVHNDTVDWGGVAFLDGVYSWGSFASNDLDMVAMHELGHTLGLDDEYDYKEKGEISGVPSKNCLHGTGVFPPWNTKVPQNSYFPICHKSNWMRTSFQSIMNDPYNTSYFNTISLEILNDSINAIAGKTVSEAPIPSVDAVTWDSKGYGYTVGYSDIYFTVSNDTYLHRVELWDEWQLIDVIYKGIQFGFSLKTQDVRAGKHNYLLRACDGLSRCGPMVKAGMPDMPSTVTPTMSPQKISTPATTTPTATATQKPTVEPTRAPTPTPTFATRPTSTPLVRPTSTPVVRPTATPVLRPTSVR